MEQNTNAEEKVMVSYFWKGLALFLLGIITGFVCAPATKGIEICCHNKDSMNCDSDHKTANDSDDNNE